MNLNTPPAPRPHPTRGSPANPSGGTRRPLSSRRTRLASWLIVPTLLALTVAGASTATAARSTGPRAFSCRNGTGARCGGAVVVALGAAATAVYAHAKHWATVIPTEAWAGGIAASLAIGGLAGLIPALRAARLSPTQALWSV